MYKQLIIDTCLEYGLSVDKAAYVLATVHHETAATFKPVKEAYWLKNAEAWRKKNLRYWPWYGRGFIQLTWEDNYIKAGKKLGRDFTTNPDDVMEPNISAKIAVLGMIEGWFTGVRLDKYLDGIDENAKEDFLEWYNSRRIVNGMDKANDIAVLAEKYEEELKASGYDKKAPTKPVDGKDEGVSYGGSQNWLITLLRLLIAIFKGKNNG